MQFELTGIDGEIWEFPGYPRLGIHEINGLQGAPYKLDTLTGVGKAGVWVMGRDDEPNIITMTVNLRPEGDPLEWVGGWLRSIGRAMPAENGGPLARLTLLDTERWQDLRLIEQSIINLDKLRYARHEKHTLKWQSDTSWWSANPAQTVITYDDLTSSGPEKTITNRGDLDSWPIFEIDGPLSNGTIGIDGEHWPIPDIFGGEVLRINTDPEWWEAKRNGINVPWWDNDRWRNKAPAGKKVPITVTGTDLHPWTKITVTVPQHYWSAV